MIKTSNIQLIVDVNSRINSISLYNFLGSFKHWWTNFHILSFRLGMEFLAFFFFKLASLFLWLMSENFSNPLTKQNKKKPPKKLSIHLELFYICCTFIHCTFIFLVYSYLDILCICFIGVFFLHTLGQSRYESNGNEGVIPNPQIS